MPDTVLSLETNWDGEACFHATAVSPSKRGWLYADFLLGVTSGPC